MKRITIICSENDQERLQKLLEDYCPFRPYAENCGEDERCDECIEKNIEFKIKEDL